jgi:hypothetical protein
MPIEPLVVTAIPGSFLFPVFLCAGPGLFAEAWRAGGGPGDCELPWVGPQGDLPPAR